MLFTSKGSLMSYSQSTVAAGASSKSTVHQMPQCREVVTDPLSQRIERLHRIQDDMRPLIRECLENPVKIKNHVTGEWEIDSR